MVMYLSLKGLNAVEIHKDLVATLKSEAKSDGNIKEYLRKRSFSSSKIPSLLRVQLQFSMSRMKQSCSLYLKSLSRRCGSLRAEPTYTLPRSTAISRTSLVSAFDTFVGSHIFCRKLTSTPEHNFHFNCSRCSSTRKAECGITL
jgi:hypothetical protein